MDLVFSFDFGSISFQHHYRVVGHLSMIDFDRFESDFFDAVHERFHFSRCLIGEYTFWNVFNV